MAASATAKLPEALAAPGDVQVRSFAFADFDALSAFFSHWKGRVEQISAGRFAGTMRVAAGRLVRVVGARVNQRILARGQGQPGQFGVYPVTLKNAQARWQGRELRPGQCVAMGPDGDTNHRSARGSELLGISLSAEAAREAACILLGTDAAAALPAWRALKPRPHVAAALEGHAQRLLALDASSLACPEGYRLEQACLRALVAAAFEPPLPRPAPLAPAGREAIVRRADELMRRRLREPVGALELCAALEVSDRTLRLAFRERFGMGPMVYFRAVRLNAVRSALREEPEEPIASLARRFGFHHLGHFAADYRRLFGELPRQTPRREAGSAALSIRA